MTKYFQPIINFGPDPIKGSLFLSDRNFWFDKVKVLQRGRKPFIINSNDVLKKLLKILQIHSIYVVIKTDHL